MFKDYSQDKGNESTQLQRLIHFLRDELAIPSASIELAVRHQPAGLNLLPMILWQYGLVTLNQLDQIFDWLETV
ncbi:MAG: DUF2949 domain-containing protein [Cyanobacteriota bacterium]|nr:DUF2949 domain-containing protein [Cyanobacteriota bacterium]